MSFVRVASLADIADGTLLPVRLDGKALCLARIGDEVYAFADNCSHRDFPLSGGEFEPESCAVTCDWHGAQFNVATGEVLCFPATRPIPVYPCRVEEDQILVDPAHPR